VNNIAIIPARGGSKRLPRKNILPFAGRPMIAWTIEAALECGVFDTVLVSTDDQEIAEIAKQEGALVPFLRVENSDDHSAVSDAIISALIQAEEHFETSYETVTQLMPNCPLRSANDIKLAFENFTNGDHDFQISAFKFGWMNPWWAVELTPNGVPEWVFPEARKSRSQDLKDLYCPTGAIWMAKSSSLLKEQSFYGEGHTMFPMDWQSAVDIDDSGDFEMALAIAKMKAAAAL